MAKAKTVSSSSDKPISRRPALSEEARENQIIADAYDLAEKQIREGTASSQVITHFLKRGSMKEKLEMERLKEENKLLRAKTKSLEDQGEYKELVAAAIKAMRNYSGQDDQDEY